jgi:hypothetical protein
MRMAKNSNRCASPDGLQEEAAAHLLGIDVCRERFF